MAQTEASSPIIVICDAGPVIHLDELGQLALLNDFSKILMPETVWEEVRKHRPQAIAFCEQFIQRVAPTLPL